MRNADDVLAAVRRGEVTPEVVAGNLIREAREKAGVTLRTLASTLGVSAPFISDVEHGRRRLTPERLAVVVQALGMDGAELENISGICTHCRGTGRRVP